MLDGNMEFKHLSTFVAIADERSFGRAAARLGYTQSAVSQQIAALERAVGMPVFYRPGGPRPVELTDAGRVLRRHADTILAQLSDADAELDLFRSGDRGRLRVGSFQSVSVQVLPRVVRGLAADLPDVEVELVESYDCDELLEMLARRDLDASFLVDRQGQHSFHEHELFSDPFVAIAAAGTMKPGPIRVADLADQPLIGQTADDVCQVSVEAGMRAAGLTDPDFVFRTADNAGVQAMARAGRGVALMPLLAVDQRDPEVSIHDLSGDMAPRTITVVWRDTPDVPPAIDRFVELVIEVTKPLAERSCTSPTDAGMVGTIES